MREVGTNGYCDKCRKDYAPVFPAMGCPRCHRAKMNSSCSHCDAQIVLVRPDADVEKCASVRS